MTIARWAVERAAAGGSFGPAFAAAGAEPAKRTRRRAEVDPKDRWRLEDIYPTAEAWDADAAKLVSLLPPMQARRGTLDDSGESLFAALAARDTVAELADRLVVYAFMRRDEDTRVPESQARADRVQGLVTRVHEALSFFEPETLAISGAALEGFFASEPALGAYRHALDDIRRRRHHTLDAAQEQLLAMAGEVVASPANVYTLFSNADLKYGTMEDETGAEVELTRGIYARFMESADRRVRREAYEKMNGAYASFNNTLGTLLGSSIKKDIFLARARKYDSSLEASLDRDQIPVAVYTGLLETANAHLEPLHRYTALRRRVLGVDRLEAYDQFAPLVPAERIDVPYERALETIVAGLEPLGSEYLDPFRRGIASGWIDVYETAGKRAGAYSWGSYSTHPYVLLNYSSTLSDQFTLAHEMGHAMHSYFTHASQPFVYSDYSTFVAEVASTMNEALLIAHLLRSDLPRARRAYLLNYYLDQIRGTFFSQALFAEFELRAHEAAERGDPVTAESLNVLYRGIFQKFYGPALHVQDLASVAWSRIPHFYTSFYVFQYATSYAAATSMSRRVLEGGAPQAKAYLEFLKSGASEYAVDLLRRAGVDLTTPKPAEDTIALFSRMVDELEALLAAP